MFLLWAAPVLAQEDAKDVLSGQPAPAGPVSVPQSLLPTHETWLGDLDGMRQRKRIRILVPFSKTFYYIDRGGTQSGITYDIGKELEAWLDKREKAAGNKGVGISIAFVPVTRDRLLPGLMEGIGDIAAANLTITDARSAIVDFSHPFVSGIREILVTAPGAPAVGSLDDLGGQAVFARASSSYYEHLETINKARVDAGKTPIDLRKLDEELEDEDIMEMVNAGLLPWAVVDERKAKLWSSLYTSMVLHPDIVIDQGGEIAWAIRKDDPLLEQMVNDFVDSHRAGSTFYNILKKRYLGSQNPAKRATSPAELKKFEKLVTLFRQFGQEYDFDALMIAAQGYQESKLNQEARSGRGAVGIMQLLPSTAADPAIGITGIDRDAEKNVHAGVKYLRLLTDKYLDDPALDDKNRTLMAFAAYNAGPGNLRKFRALAAKSGLDPNVWFGNVEHAAADIVGRETVQYVSNIYIYYVAYRLVSERRAEREKAKQNLPAAPAAPAAPAVQ
ncbi:MAG TPA: lytic transglycosylase F [Candidatus Binatia bacterium]|nr:lytic transglycosylase F [Candidatus Binatia bacterium]